MAHVIAGFTCTDVLWTTFFFHCWF